MSVLVTGGAGYIGSHVTLALLDDEHEVVVLDNLTTGHRRAVPKDAHLVVGDVGDRELVFQTIQQHNVDAVLHFAGSIIVPESVVNPNLYYFNNTAKSQALIETCVRAAVSSFIFSSSAAVYGIPSTKSVSEQSPTLPVSPYGTSKLMTEWMLRDTSIAHDLKYVALRYFNVAGADPERRTGQSTQNATHLLKIATQTVLGERDFMEIFGTDYNTPDGTCIRDYIHVSDLAAAHLDALSFLRSGGESSVVNCGYEQGYSVREIIDAIEAATGQKIKAVEAARRPGDPPYLVAKAGKAKQLLGWKPRYGVSEIVETALAWEKKLGSMKASN